MTPSPDPTRVREMFSGIATRYDLLNHLLSFNLDRLWRRRAVAELPRDGKARILDLCTGTGDLALAVGRGHRAGTVVCCDFARPMLVRAHAKLARSGHSERYLLVEADGLRLPFAPDTFDAVTVGFGVRNLADMEAGFREILRILKPGGRVVVLEFSRPKTPGFAALYRFYLRRVLPKIGDGTTGRRGAYLYLARTVTDFDDPATLAGRLREAGFAAAGWRPLTGGIACVHAAFKGTGGGGERPSARGDGSPPARR